MQPSRLCRSLSVTMLAATVFSPAHGAAQSVLHFSLDFGPHAVGYRSVIVYDRSRNIPKDTVDATGAPVTTPRPRPIHLSVWYPARPSTVAPMRYRDYLALYDSLFLVPAKTDSGWRAAEESLLRWHNLLRHVPGVTVEARRDSLRAAIAREAPVRTHATRDAPADGRAYPIVIYGAGAEGPSFENDVLMEFLASRGYLAIGVPSRTNDGGEFTTTAASLENEARDMEYGLRYARELPREGTQPAAMIGWSWGGLANVVAAARNQSIDAIVGLDPSVRYFWHDPSLREKVDASRPYATPSLFINQGVTPAAVIAQAGGDTTFTFYESLRYADAYRVTMKDLGHQNFASMYNRLAGPQVNFFASDRQVASAGYTTLVSYVSTFLDAYLRHDARAQQRLTETPGQLGLPDTNVVITSKLGHRPVPTMAGFRKALSTHDWSTAPDVLARLQAADPGYTLNRDSLEDSGSTFLDDDRVAEALGVYRVYTKLYPREPQPWNGLADAYAAAHDTANAIASYQEALKLAPTDARATAGLKRMGKAPPPTQPHER